MDNQKSGKYKALVEALARINDAPTVTISKSVLGDPGSTDDIDLVKSYYSRACELYLQGANESLREAYEIFSVLGEYENSEGLKNNCVKLYPGVKKDPEKERIRKEKIKGLAIDAAIFAVAFLACVVAPIISIIGVINITVKGYDIVQHWMIVISFIVSSFASSFFGLLAYFSHCLDDYSDKISNFIAITWLIFLISCLCWVILDLIFGVVWLFLIPCGLALIPCIVSFVLLIKARIEY